jgi:hypothetical protein
VDVLSAIVARGDALIVFIARGLPGDKNQFHVPLHGDDPLEGGMLEEFGRVDLLSLHFHFQSLAWAHEFDMASKSRKGGFSNYAGDAFE